MANRLFKTPLRALDASGDGISGAKVYLYETGTTTPVTAYTDAGAGTAHPTPLVADGGGTFVELFVSGSAGVKVDVTDSVGASLDGYPVDPVYPESDASTGAANVTFAPTTDLPETDTQAAIEAVDAKVRVLEAGATGGADIYTTAGTATAYTIAVTDVTAYATNDRYWIRVDQTNTGAATLNVQSAGAKDVYKYDSAGAAAVVVAADLVIGSEYLVHYDGTQFVIISERLARAADSVWEAGTSAVQYAPSPANIRAAGVERRESTAVIAADATVDFTLATGDEHIFRFANVTPANLSEMFWVKISDDSKVTFEDTKLSATTTTGNANLTAGAAVGGDANEFGVMGELVISQLSGDYPHARFSVTYTDALSSVRSLNSGFSVLTTTDITDVRFMFENGDLASGEIHYNTRTHS